jgi:DNA-cytosine methyltransferase
MRHGSLFSGIGGFDLAAEWMRWENVFHCEWNEFGQRVLKHYWPNAELFTDITKSDFTKYANTIDILTGGFPCQPYSAAGKRLGKEDERHLWPEMLRVIREVSPRFVVGENVRGLTNWNGGMVFDEVCTDLENLGYQVAPFIIPASAVNAPHQRERVWFVAYCDSFRQHECKCEHEKHAGQRRINALNDIEQNDERGNATNTNGNGQQASSHELHISKEGVAKPIRESGTKGNSNLYATLQIRGMLPTPTAMDSTNATANMKSSQVKPGSMHSMTLTRMLCTPTAQASRGNTSDKRGKGNLTDQIAEMDLTTSKTSQLNPRFVAEMMGFPPTWTELPFQNGETNQ